MSTALDRLGDVEAKLDRIIALLEAQTGQQVQPDGVTVGADGRVFIPGTGWTGTAWPEPEDEPDGGPTSAAEVRAALAASRQTTEEP